MRRIVMGWHKLTSAIQQSHILVKGGGVVIGIACVLHIILGANPIVVCFAGLAFFISIYPIAVLGFLNIGAVLFALVGFRYVGFPLLAKLAFQQPLDTYLFDPLGSYGVAGIGILAYLIALRLASCFSVGKPCLDPWLSHRLLGRISVLAAIVGIAANMVVAFRIDEPYTGTTVADFFVPFIHLSLISAIARVIHKSKGSRSVDAWVILLFTLELEFAMVRNSRMVLMEAILCWIVTSVAFEAKLKWKHFLITVFAIVMMGSFITPVFLYLRSFRDDLSWILRLNTTMETVSNSQEAMDYYETWREFSSRVGWYRSYYGDTRNVFERMSHINNVDILKDGADSSGILGIEDLQIALNRTLPRILEPDKPQGYGHGAWIYQSIGIPNPGPYPTAPLIGSGYASFGWAGAFCYPLILGFAWMIIIKKISGLNLQGNIWAVYMLLRVHNQFVEGSSDSYVAHILRILPQDFVLLGLVAAVARGRFLHPWRRKISNVFEQ